MQREDQESGTRWAQQRADERDVDSDRGAFHVDLGDWNPSGVVLRIIIRPVQQPVQHVGAQLGSQLLGRDGEHVIACTDGHEMTGSLDLMPYRSGHPNSHRSVDGSRDKPIVRTLPHVDRPFDGGHVKRPTPIEKFAVANQPVAALREHSALASQKAVSTSG